MVVIQDRDIPNWMELDKRKIWESKNGNWCIERFGTMDNPKYKVIGENEEYPFSYNENINSLPIPKYVKKAIKDDPTREQLQKIRFFHTEQFGWVAVSRWNYRPFEYSYDVYIAETDDREMNSIRYIYDRPMYSLKSESHSEIKDMSQFCDSIISEVFQG